MFRKVLHCVVLAVFLVQITGCTTSHALTTQQVTPERLSEAKVVVLHTDRGTIELDNVQLEPPIVRGHPRNPPTPEGTILEVRLDEIHAVEVKDYSKGKTVVLGVVVGAAAISGILLAVVAASLSDAQWM